MKKQVLNPVIPNCGTTPVAVSKETVQMQNHVNCGIPEGEWCGIESEIPKGGWRGVESSIPKGGWRAPSPVARDVYHSTTGHLFEFGFYLVNNSHYEIDILSMPDYGNRDSSYHHTHRLPSNHGNESRICFGDDSVVSSMESAKQWAATWSEHTINYILENTPFPNE